MLPALLEWKIYSNIRQVPSTSILGIGRIFRGQVALTFHDNFLMKGLLICNLKKKKNFLQSISFSGSFIH